jgi:hypothetical protein
MNERIKELAEQAGLVKFNFGEQGGYTTIQAVTDLNNLERFAELVRQDEREVNAELVEALENVTAHLVGAHELIQTGGKKAASSNTMFAMILKDYEKSIAVGLAAIRGRTE